MRCGHYGISIPECRAMGCCVDLLASVCYYPLEGKASFLTDGINVEFLIRET